MDDMVLEISIWTIRVTATQVEKCVGFMRAAEAVVDVRAVTGQTTLMALKTLLDGLISESTLWTNLQTFTIV